MPLAFTYPPILLSVVFVFFFCSVTQIGNKVIHLVVIGVQGFQSFWLGSFEGKKD